MLRGNLAYRKLIRDPRLWKQGGGTRNGQREKMKCDVVLAKPWSLSQGIMLQIYMGLNSPSVIRMDMGRPGKGKLWVKQLSAAKGKPEGADSILRS